jgi:hypothetical protein
MCRIGERATAVLKLCKHLEEYFTGAPDGVKSPTRLAVEDVKFARSSRI